MLSQWASAFVVLFSAGGMDVEWSACMPRQPSRTSARAPPSHLFALPPHVHYTRGLRKLRRSSLSCANMSVPLDWQAAAISDKQAEQIQISLSRIAATGARKGSIWLLMGGPGYDGQSLLPMAQAMHRLVGGSFDVMLPDHRGTGASTPLTCPDNRPKPCAEFLRRTWGARLHQFTTEAAAHDLRYLIHETLDSVSDEIYLWGGSYGSYWLNRYVQVAPEQPTAVHFDGFCPSDVCRVQWYDELGQAGAGKDFMSLCDRDLACSSRFGQLALEAGRALRQLPSMLLYETYAAIKAGDHKCAKAANITHVKLGALLAALNMQFDLRPLIPALLLRLVRCDDNDTQQLRHAFSEQVLSQYVADFVVLPSGRAAPTQPLDQVMMLNVVLSELFGSPRNASVPPPSFNELHAASAAVPFATQWPATQRLYYDAWDRYIPNPELYGKRAGIDDNASVPMLITQGDLDPQTSILWTATVAGDYQTRTTGPTKLVIVPRAAHCTVDNAPIEGSPYTCGEVMLASLVRSRGLKVDDSCAVKVEAVDFEGRQHHTVDAAQKLFGAPELWGSAGSKSGSVWL